MVFFLARSRHSPTWWECICDPAKQALSPGGMGVARALEIHESSWGVYLVLVHAVVLSFQFQHLGLFLSSSFL